MTEEPKSNRPVWQSETEYPELCEQLRQSLRAVQDPELGMDVIQLGLIRNVIIEEDHAVVEMILTTPFCPYAPAMIDMVKRNAEKSLKREVSISLSMEPWDYSMMEDGGESAWGFFR